MKKKLSFIIEIIIGIIFICFGYFVIDTDYYATLFYAMGFGLAFASGVQLLKICYYEMPKNKEKLQNIINHIFGMTCDRIQEGEIDFAMNHKKCIYCAADDFEDLMAEPEKIICVEMPNVTHHAWKTLDDAKKVQRIEKALMENKVI